MQWTIDRFPGLEHNLRNLAAQHREFQDEPLHLAIAFDPGHDHKDVFLFELLGNFGGNSISPDAEFFEASFDSTPQFPMSPGQKLHLILTSPAEFKRAGEERWKSFGKLQDAIRRGDFEVLYKDSIGDDALRFLQ